MRPVADENAIPRKIDTAHWEWEPTTVTEDLLNRIASALENILDRLDTILEIQGWRRI